VKTSDYQTETARGHRFSVGPANFLCHSHKKMPDLNMQDLSMPGALTRKSGHDRPFRDPETKA
jgi:hypothetical protein